MHDITDDVKAIRNDLSDIKVDVARNTVSLEHHIARTDVAERRLEKLEMVFISLAVIGVLGGVIKLLIS